MEFWKKQKKTGIAFGIFLLFMFICTLVSRAVYASKLPQVSVEKARRMPIVHKVEAVGSVYQGREAAVNVLSGLRVRTIYVHVGDRITPETLLFEIDTDDLRELADEQELAIKKLQLQIADQEKNRMLAAQNSQTDRNRAKEDYVRAEKEADKNVQDKEEELKQAREALKKKKDNPTAVTSEAKREEMRVAYRAWTEKRDNLKAEMDAAKTEYDAAAEYVKELEAASGGALGGASGGTDSSELTVAREQETEKKTQYEGKKFAYDSWMESPVQMPDFSAEDSAKSAWEAEKKALELQVNSAEKAVEGAKRAEQEAMLEAGRKVEDANRENMSDSSLEVSCLELSSMQKKLESYEEILNRNGQVFPEAEGIITHIRVSPGERVPDGAAVVYADLSSPMEFHVALTKEQKRYVNQGDTGRISFGSSFGKEYMVDYVAEKENSPGTYEACIFLPEGVGALGQSGELEVSTQSETYSCCIPLAALQEDSNHRKFVYVVSEKDGILGKELAAEIVYVKVLDQNDSYAAIEEGVIDGDTELIVASTEPIEDRSVIRYRE